MNLNPEEILVCPSCKSKLHRRMECYVCSQCRVEFRKVGGVWCLLPPSGIEDVNELAQMQVYDDRSQRGWIDQHAINRKALLDGSAYKPTSFKSLKLRAILDSLGIESDDIMLDVGCGIGYFLQMCSAIYGVQGIGVDLSRNSIAQALELDLFQNYYYQADVESLPFDDGTFDGIISIGLFEHLSHPNKCIEEIARVVKPGGWVVVDTLSRNDRYTDFWIARSLIRIIKGRKAMNQFLEDAYRETGHKLENFFDRDQFYSMAWQSGIDGRIIPYCGPFTGMEHLAGRLWRLLTKSQGTRALLTYESSPPSTSISILKKLTSNPGYAWILKVARPICELLDSPFWRRGYGASFYFIGRKGT